MDPITHAHETPAEDSSTVSPATVAALHDHQPHLPVSRRYLPGARTALDRAGITTSTIEEILADPVTHREPGRNGAVVFEARYLRIVIGRDGTVLRVEDHNPLGTAKGGQPRVSGHKTQERRPRPTTRPALIRVLEDHGFTITPGRKHATITHPDHPGRRSTMPTSPSDHRWIENQIRDIKHVFGIDLRAQNTRS